MIDSLLDLASSLGKGRFRSVRSPVWVGRFLLVLLRRSRIVSRRVHDLKPPRIQLDTDRLLWLDRVGCEGRECANLTEGWRLDIALLYLTHKELAHGKFSRELRRNSALGEQDAFRHLKAVVSRGYFDRDFVAVAVCVWVDRR